MTIAQQDQVVTTVAEVVDLRSADAELLQAPNHTAELEPRYTAAELVAVRTVVEMNP